MEVYNRREHQVRIQTCRACKPANEQSDRITWQGMPCLVDKLLHEPIKGKELGVGGEHAEVALGHEAR